MKASLKSALIIGCTHLLVTITSQAQAMPIPPIVRVAEWKSFVELKAKLPADTRVWSLWDFAVLSGSAENLKEYPVKDGVAFFPISYFLSMGLVSPDPAELARVVRFIDAKNPAPGRWMSGIDALLKEYADYTPENFQSGDVHVLITEQMVMHFPSIYYTATWDFASDTGEINGFDTFDCLKLGGNFELSCAKNKIDVTAGMVDGGPILRGVDFVIAGKLTRSEDYGRPNGKYLVVTAAKDGKIRHVLFLDEGHYRSNFIQMYILGKFDANLFEQTATADAIYKLFRLK